MSSILYIKNLLKDRQVASIAPTSRFGVRKVCAKIDFAKRNVIVEYGPATGVFSTYMLSQLTPDSELILIERNSNFAGFLKQLFNDARVSVYCESAESVSDIVRDRLGEAKADYILSGVPFSFCSDTVRNRIVTESHKVLHKDGKFLPYQTFFQKNDHLKNHLDQHFPAVSTEYCFLNTPPLRIYEAVK